MLNKTLFRLHLLLYSTNGKIAWSIHQDRVERTLEHFAIEDLFNRLFQDFVVGTMR